MLLIRDSTLKRAFLCSSCWALAPVLNEFIVSTAFGDVDYSSNVGNGLSISLIENVRYFQQSNALTELGANRVSKWDGRTGAFKSATAAVGDQIETVSASVLIAEHLS
jgi:hypothetical protein